MVSWPFRRDEFFVNELVVQLLARDPQDIIRPQTMSNRQFHQDHPPLVLAVDTSSACASFAIAHGEVVIASLKTDAPIPHSKTFFNQVSSLLQTSEVSLSEMDAFAAATGPGSFTGLRVGLSAVMGLSHALCVPAVGVNSLDALALASKATGKVLVMINAGREEVYVGLRFIREDKIPEILGEDMVGPASRIIHSFDQFTQGDSLTVIRNGFNDQVMDLVANTAEEVAIYATRILVNKSDFNLHPHYVRPSDAEIKRKE
jgi:tRNA threonylcarbamoyladenosine biosynthesis protein TsaB